MTKCTEILTVKLPREMVAAMKAAEKKTGLNRSELAREAITLGLKLAIARQLRESKETRDMLTVAG